MDQSFKKPRQIRVGLIDKKCGGAECTREIRLLLSWTELLLGQPSRIPSRIESDY